MQFSTVPLQIRDCMHAGYEQVAKSLPILPHEAIQFLYVLLCDVAGLRPNRVERELQTAEIYI